ncbi:YggS family pyridoxal phosphate-dependent enzyme [Candidatus Pelagibacter sp.]|nr:YggS family pyridoxal phosphate-dependent enzyme [Candidatus Pelagibacter sp.]
MHKSIQNFLNIENKIKLNFSNLQNNDLPKIIAVSKTFSMDHIMPLINYGHKNFGENKVQEAIDKWVQIKIKNPDIKLHMIGRLQSNKVKSALSVFDYIHSVDSLKLAKKISEEQIKLGKKVKIFIQVNIGNEDQKSGIKKNELKDLILYCKELNLDLLGLMCIPPINNDPTFYFKDMYTLNKNFGFSELSMGMSSDYLKAIENSATYIRIGSSIFGERF